MAAEQQLGSASEADKDFMIAETSMHEAEKAIGDAKMSDYYHELSQRILQQHAALLETDNKHGQAQRVLNKFYQ